MKYHILILAGIMCIAACKKEKETAPADNINIADTTGTKDTTAQQKPTLPDSIVNIYYGRSIYQYSLDRVPIYDTTDPDSFRVVYKPKDTVVIVQGLNPNGKGHGSYTYKSKDRWNDSSFGRVGLGNHNDYYKRNDTIWTSSHLSAQFPSDIGWYFEFKGIKK